MFVLKEMSNPATGDDFSEEKRELVRFLVRNKRDVLAGSTQLKSKLVPRPDSIRSSSSGSGNAFLGSNRTSSKSNGSPPAAYAGPGPTTPTSSSGTINAGGARETLKSEALLHMPAATLEAMLERLVPLEDLKSMATMRDAQACRDWEYRKLASEALERERNKPPRTSSNPKEGARVAPASYRLSGSGNNSRASSASAFLNSSALGPQRVLVAPSSGPTAHLRRNSSSSSSGTVSLKTGTGAVVARIPQLNPINAPPSRRSNSNSSRSSAGAAGQEHNGQEEVENTPRASTIEPAEDARTISDYDQDPDNSVDQLDRTSGGTTSLDATVRQSSLTSTGGRPPFNRSSATSPGSSSSSRNSVSGRVRGGNASQPAVISYKQDGSGTYNLVGRRGPSPGGVAPYAVLSRKSALSASSDRNSTTTTTSQQMSLSGSTTTSSAGGTQGAATITTPVVTPGARGGMAPLGRGGLGGGLQPPNTAVTKAKSIDNSPGGGATPSLDIWLGNNTTQGAFGMNSNQGVFGNLFGEGAPRPQDVEELSPAIHQNSAKHRQEHQLQQRPEGEVSSRGPSVVEGDSGAPTSSVSKGSRSGPHDPAQQQARLQLTSINLSEVNLDSATSLTVGAAAATLRFSRMQRTSDPELIRRRKSLSKSLPWNTTIEIQRYRDAQSEAEREELMETLKKDVNVRDIGNYGYPRNAPHKMNPAYWLPMLAKFGTNAMGMAGLTLGFGVASFGRATVGTKLHESPVLESSLIALLRLNGLTCTVTYPKGESAASLNESPFMVANHTTYLDGVIIATELNYPQIISMEAAKQVPMVGEFMKDMDTIWLDRNNKDSRKSVFEAITKHGRKWRRGDRPLFVFPEGQTSAGRTILPFRQGVFTSGLPVRPVILLYTGEFDLAMPHFIRTKSSDGNIVLRPFFDSDWFDQLLRGMVHSVIVKVCRVYYPSEEERANPDLYAANVHRFMKYEYDKLKLLHDQRTLRVDLRQKGTGPGYSEDNRIPATNMEASEAIPPAGDVDRFPMRISEDTGAPEIVVPKSWRGHMPYNGEQLEKLRPWVLAKSREMVQRGELFKRQHHQMSLQQQQVPPPGGGSGPTLVGSTPGSPAGSPKHSSPGTAGKASSPSFQPQQRSNVLRSLEKTRTSLGERPSGSRNSAPDDAESSPTSSVYSSRPRSSASAGDLVYKRRATDSQAVMRPRGSSSQQKYNHSGDTIIKEYNVGASGSTRPRPQHSKPQFSSAPSVEEFLDDQTSLSEVEDDDEQVLEQHLGAVARAKANPQLNQQAAAQ
ncbi:unnamed protein product [Amoebophrya sp. A25]|nr:unnamed protein product [Amoebophrya sp. A25]|eukprot:GSA25T00008016001.1